MTEEFDNEWIENFEKESIFYPQKVEKIRVYILYINTNCILDKVIKNEIHLSKENCLTQQELVNLLRKKKI